VFTDKAAGTEIARMLVKTTAPAWNQNDSCLPSVKVAGVSSTKLQLTLGLPAGAEEPNTGALWYKVEYGKQSDATYPADNVVYFKSDGNQIQSETITLGSDETAAKEEYAVKLTLIQTKTHAALTKETEETAALYRSKEVTVEPIYEANLGLKKGTTTIYTGQTAAAATVQYSQKTTYVKASAVVKDSSGAAAKGISARVDADGKVYVTVNNSYVTPEGVEAYEYAAPGKYTLEVTADAREDTQSSGKSLAITVVRGIEEIEVPASDRIYKESGKSATLKITPVLNGDSKSVQPKAKKVTYAIVDAKTHEELPETTGVTVNNGTVTVGKDCTLAGPDHTFKVRVQAADYADSTVVGYSEPIQITSAKLEPQTVCIVKETQEAAGEDAAGEEAGTYTVVAVSGSTVTPGKLAGTKVIALTGSDIKEGDKLPENDESIIPAAAVTFKSSNKILTIDGDGNITVDNKTAKKVSITVTANDGGKNKAVLQNLNIDYASAAVYGLRAADAVSGEEISDDYGNTEIPYNGTNATALQLSIMKKVTPEDDWTSASDNLYDVKLTVDKNAKIIDKSQSALGVYTILLSKGSAKVTLTYTKDGKKIEDEYTITNNTYVETAAPKLKASGTLYANYTIENQQISYQITDGYTAYTDDTRHARIELDPASLYGTNQKVKAQYQSLASSLGYSVGMVNVEKDGSFVLDFKKSQEENWTGISAGNYKLWMTIGYYRGDGTFVPETKSQAVTLKAAAFAKVSYKPVTSVKLSATDKASVQLAGSGKNYDAATEQYTNLRNVNTAGTINQFTTYFELDDDNNLTLKPDAAINQIDYLTRKDGKVHCTGYADYSYQGVNGITYSGTTKITVTLSAGKALDKYSAAKTTIVKEDTEAKQIATVNILAGKQNADLLAAVVTSDNTPFSLTENGVNGSQITLKYGDGIAAGTYDVTLKVLPQNSLYSEYAAKGNKAYRDSLVKDYGIEVKASITVKDKATATGKISVASKDRTQTFLNSQYDAATQSYWVKVPYTTVIPCDIDRIDSDDSVEGLISFAAEDGYIVISLDKEKFAARIENGKFDGKKEPQKTKLSAKATVRFKGSAAENITFNLTLPKEPSSQKYDSAVTEIRNNQRTIASAVTVAYRTNMTGLDENGVPSELTFTGTEEDLNGGEHAFLASVYEAVCNSLYDAIREYAPAESDVVISFRQITTDDNGQITINLAADDFTKPTSAEEGSLTVKADLTDGSRTGDAPEASETITFALKIPQTGEQPADVQDALKAFADNFQTYNYKITNVTTEAEIADMAYNEVIKGKPQYASLRIRVKIDEKNSVDATETTPGCKKGTLTAYGTRYGGEGDPVEFSFEIDRLPTIAEAKAAIYNESEPKGALNRMTFTNETTAAMVMEAAKGAVTNPDLELAWAKGKASEWGGKGDGTVDAFLNTPAGRNAEGHVKGILILYEAGTDPEDAGDDHRISFDFVMEKQLGQEEALKKIQTAIGIKDDGSYDTSVINELAKSNSADEIKQAFLDAAQEVVANDGFKVEMDEITFAFTPATHRVCGSVSFTLKVQDTVYQGAKAGEIAFAAQAPAKTTQTIAEAYADVKDALEGANKLTIPQGEEAPTEEEITAAAEAQLAAYDNGAGAVIAGSGITAEVASLIPQAPTQSAAGYAWIRVDLSKEGSEEEPQTYYLYLDLPKLGQSFAEAKAAVEALAQDSSLTVNNEDYSRRQWKQNKLLSAAQAAVDTDLYTVSVKEDLVITKSTLTAKGSAAITFTMKDSSGKEEDVTLTWVIPMVVARYICSCGYSTYDKKEMASHAVAGEALGETHSYTTDYEYAQE
jgi:hypothetical protein